MVLDYYQVYLFKKILMLLSTLFFCIYIRYWCLCCCALFLLCFHCVCCAAALLLSCLPLSVTSCDAPVVPFDSKGFSSTYTPPTDFFKAPKQMVLAGAGMRRKRYEGGEG